MCGNRGSYFFGRRTHPHRGGFADRSAEENPAGADRMNSGQSDPFFEGLEDDLRESDLDHIDSPRGDPLRIWSGLPPTAPLLVEYQILMERGNS